MPGEYRLLTTDRHEVTAVWQAFGDRTAAATRWHV